MKIVFLSNFLNHHQLQLCHSFVELTQNNFYFVATEPTPKERLELGYYDMNEKYHFVIPAYKGNDEYNKTKQIVISADVAIIRSAPEELITERIPC